MIGSSAQLEEPRMTFELGIFEEFGRREGQTEAESFHEAFARIDAAEQNGVDVVWLAELHVAPKRSVLAAPLNIATAIAMRTHR